MLRAAVVAKTTVTLMSNFVAMNLEANGEVLNPDFGVMWVV